MKVAFSRQALADLDEILGYITPASPAGAARVHAQVRRAIERIALYPGGSPTLRQRPDIRRAPLVRYPYLIYYQIGTDAVTILRILHGARRQPFEDVRA